MCSTSVSVRSGARILPSMLATVWVRSRLLIMIICSRAPIPGRSLSILACSTTVMLLLLLLLVIRCSGLLWRVVTTLLVLGRVAIRALSRGWGAIGLWMTRVRGVLLLLLSVGILWIVATWGR